MYSPFFPARFHYVVYCELLCVTKLLFDRIHSKAHLCWIVICSIFMCFWRYLYIGEIERWLTELNLVISSYALSLHCVNKFNKRCVDSIIFSSALEINFSVNYYRTHFCLQTLHHSSESNFLLFLLEQLPEISFSL